MGKVLPFKRMKKKPISPAPDIANLENELVRLEIELILNDDYGAKDTKRKKADIENRIKELRSKERELNR